MTEDFYDVLGVSADASADEIRAAYRERLKRVHPDVSDAPDAAERTETLVDAKEVLTDPDERARYDRLGHETYVSGARGTVTGGSRGPAAATDRSSAGTAAGDDAPGDGTSGGDDAAGDPTDEAGGEDPWSWTDTDEGDPWTWSDPGEAAEERSATTAGTSAAERRRRERRAARRVRESRRRTRRAGEGSSGRNRRDEEDVAGVGGRSGTATATDPRGRNVGSGSPWVSESGFEVGGAYEEGPLAARLAPTRGSLSLLAITFVSYPLLLFGALLPAFPLGVNVLVAVCTLLVIAYLQSIPEAGVLVFGIWSLASPAALLLLGLGPESLLGLAILLATWLPFGFSLLTYAVVRP